MVGAIDSIDCGIISGWAYDPEQSKARLQVEVIIGNRVLASVEASLFRKDLVDAGHGDGWSGFVIHLSGEDWRFIIERREELFLSVHAPGSDEQIYVHTSEKAAAFLSKENWRRIFLSAPALANVQLAALCIIKNEAHCVEEWIAYHIIRGVQFFIFYDNDSTDNLHEILEPYVRGGLAKIVGWPNFVLDPAARSRA